MDEVNETLIAIAAENYADSLERRGCAFWQGLYRGYIAGYRACDGKESSDELPASNCIKHAVNQQRELLVNFMVFLDKKEPFSAFTPTDMDEFLGINQ